MCCIVIFLLLVVVVGEIGSLFPELMMLVHAVDDVLDGPMREPLFEVVDCDF